MNGRKKDPAQDTQLFYKNPEQAIELNEEAALTTAEQALYAAPAGDCAWARDDTAWD